MRLTRLLTTGVLTALAAALTLPAVSAGASTRASGKPTIIIGSTNFEEQAIVSNIWADVLQKAGYTVKVEPALIAGIELETPHAVVRNSFRADLVRLKSGLIHHDTDAA